MKNTIIKKIANLNSHDKTWVYYQIIGRIPVSYTPGEYALHHIDPELKYTDKARYDEWRIEDVIPVTAAEHKAIHNKYDHEHGIGVFSPDAIAKRSKTRSDEAKANISEGIKNFWATISSEDYEDVCRRAKERANDPEVIKKLKEAWTPERRQVASEQMKKQNAEWNSDDEFKARRSLKAHETMAEKLTDEEYRKEHGKRISDSLNAFYASDKSEDTRRTLSEKSKERWTDPEYKKRVSENIRQTLNDQEIRARRSEITKDLIWINNGTVDRRIKSSDQIPEGFTFGRCSGDHKKKILQCDLNGNIIAEFESQGEAAASMGLKSQANLSVAIKKGVPYRNSIWRFIS